MSGPEATHDAARAAQGEQARRQPAHRGRSRADPDENLPARLGEERLAEPVARTGMFGAQDTPATPPVTAAAPGPPRPGPGQPAPVRLLLRRRRRRAGPRARAAGLGFSDAIERVVVDRGELTFHVRRERLPEVAAKLRDDPALALRAVHRRVRRALPGRHRPGAARGLPPAVDHPQPAAPARGDRAGRRPAHPLAGRRLPDLRLARAGDLGLLRHHLRRPSRR